MPSTSCKAWDRAYISQDFNFKSNSPLDRNNNYWKIVYHSLWPGVCTIKELKARLEQHGYAFGSTSSKAWLHQSLIRADRGLMSYVSCTDAELRGFLNTRGIGSGTLIAKRAKGKRNEMIKLLDDADLDSHFDKFLDLPPEVRNTIYLMHFSQFDQPIYNSKQPPLTLCSRQIRRETLQLFYSLCNFGIAFNIRDISHDGNITYSTPEQSLFWLRSLPTANFASIRTLSFNMGDYLMSDFLLAFDDWQQWHELATMSHFELQVSPHGHEKFRLSFAEGPANDRYDDLIIMRGRLRDVVAAKNSRGETDLTVDDVEALRAAMGVGSLLQVTRGHLAHRGGTRSEERQAISMANDIEQKGSKPGSRGGGLQHLSLLLLPISNWGSGKARCSVHDQRRSTTS